MHSRSKGPGTHPVIPRPATLVKLAACLTSLIVASCGGDNKDSGGSMAGEQRDGSSSVDAPPSAERRDSSPSTPGADAVARPDQSSAADAGRPSGPVSDAGAADATRPDASPADAISGRSDAATPAVCAWKLPAPVATGPSVWPYPDPGTGPCTYTRETGLKGACFARCAPETTRKFYDAWAIDDYDTLNKALADDKTPSITVKKDGASVVLNCDQCFTLQNEHCVRATCPAEDKVWVDCVAKANGDNSLCMAEGEALDACLYGEKLEQFDLCFETAQPLCFAQEFARAKNIWKR